MDNSILNTTPKIVWLASYPKSGNTWFRAFITALFNDGDVDINNMITDGIFSSRKKIDDYTDLDSTNLYAAEAKILQGMVTNQIAIGHQKEQLFIKVHDAYTLNPDNSPVIPAQHTRCAVYFIRNPLDVAGSLAGHKDSTIDEAIELLNDQEGRFSKQDNGCNTKIQFEQLLLDWSGHVESWTANLPFPVLVLRYEDMLADTFNTFERATKFIGLSVSKQQIETAIAASSFEQLQQKEREKGFVEKTKAAAFFRKGISGGWKNELNEYQIETILSHHRTVMDTYGYIGL